MTNYKFSEKITELNIAAQISKYERKTVLDRVNEQRKQIWKSLKNKLGAGKGKRTEGKSVIER